MRFLTALASGLLALSSQVLSIEIVKEVEVDTQLTALQKHIHLDHIFRHKNGVYTGDYFNNHLLNGETLKEEKRTIWTDSFFTFMWLPQEVALVQDHYAVYVSHQRNGSPPPYCAIIKYDLDSMYPDVGRSDTIKPAATDSSTVGYFSLPIDAQRGVAHLLNGGDYITVNVNETFSGFRITGESTFRYSSVGHYSALSSDGRFLYFTDGNELKKLDTNLRSVVDSLTSPGDARRGSLYQLAVDSNQQYAYSISYRSYIREFPNVTYECFIIKYDLQNFVIVDYESYSACEGSSFTTSFGFVDPTNRFVYFGSASTGTRVLSTDTIVKVDTARLAIVETLKTNYQINKVVYDRNNQALAVGTLKGTEIENQYALVINL